MKISLTSTALLFLWTASSSFTIARLLSDDQLIKLHSGFLSEDQLEDFRRRLRGSRNKSSKLDHKHQPFPDHLPKPQEPHHDAPRRLLDPSPAGNCNGGSGCTGSGNGWGDGTGTGGGAYGYGPGDGMGTGNGGSGFGGTGNSACPGGGSCSGNSAGGNGWGDGSGLGGQANGYGPGDGTGSGGGAYGPGPGYPVANAAYGYGDGSGNGTSSNTGALGYGGVGNPNCNGTCGNNQGYKGIRGPTGDNDWSRGGGFQGDELQVIMYLVNNRDWIERTSEDIRDKKSNQLLGVEVTTFSENPDVAAALLKHVTQMTELVDSGRIVRARDPLFAELFKRAQANEFIFNVTQFNDGNKSGVKIIEEGKTKCAAELTKQHALTVKAFIEAGRAELRNFDHAPPEICSRLEGDNKTGI